MALDAVCWSNGKLSAASAYIQNAIFSDLLLVTPLYYNMYKRNEYRTTNEHTNMWRGKRWRRNETTDTILYIKWRRRSSTKNQHNTPITVSQLIGVHFIFEYFCWFFFLSLVISGYRKFKKYFQNAFVASVCNFSIGCLRKMRMIVFCVLGEYADLLGDMSPYIFYWMLSRCYCYFVVLARSFVSFFVFISKRFYCSTKREMIPGD